MKRKRDNASVTQLLVESVSARLAPGLVLHLLVAAVHLAVGPVRASVQVLPPSAALVVEAPVQSGRRRDCVPSG